MQEGNYLQAWQQLKAIRQDLTVQHVEGELAVDAYETHARIAIESGDWAEFQQCQSVLQRLYSKGVRPQLLYGCFTGGHGSGLLVTRVAMLAAGPGCLGDGLAASMCMLRVCNFGAS